MARQDTDRVRGKVFSFPLHHVLEFSDCDLELQSSRRQPASRLHDAVTCASSTSLDAVGFLPLFGIFKSKVGVGILKLVIATAFHDGTFFSL